MRNFIFTVALLCLSLAGCDAQAGPPPVATLAQIATPAATLAQAATPAPSAASPVAAAPHAGTGAPSGVPARTTPTPAATETPPGMTIKADGQALVLSNTAYYWSMSIPRDWLTSGNNGFEFYANQPDKRAFVHLLSQTWLSKDRKSNAQAYVDYWKNFKYGNLFPIGVPGALVGHAEVSQGKFGGPYLRYEFEDGKAGMRYVQVYASGGGPSSIVASVWAASADYPALKSTLDAIINSVTLLNTQ